MDVSQIIIIQPLNNVVVSCDGLIIYSNSHYSIQRWIETHTNIFDVSHFSDRIQYFEKNSCAIFRRTTIFISSIISIFAEKLL
ncbi:hypothetical protein D3C80_1367010 [compost metagenome]